MALNDEVIRMEYDGAAGTIRREHIRVCQRCRSASRHGDVRRTEWFVVYRIRPRAHGRLAVLAGAGHLDEGDFICHRHAARPAQEDCHTGIVWARQPLCQPGFVPAACP